MEDFNTTIIAAFILVLYAAIYTKLSLFLFPSITALQNVALFMFVTVGAPLIVYYLIKFIKGE